MVLCCDVHFVLVPAVFRERSVFYCYLQRFQTLQQKNAKPSHASAHFAKCVLQKNEMDCPRLHTFHMPKPNVTRVQSATQSTASVHTLHMPKPNVTRVQSATQSTASVHTLHMPKPNVTRVQSATQSTASVHTLHMPKPNVTRVQSATQSTASVHTFTHAQT